ncbi:DNA ligase D [Halopseudomonas pelagia]|uniref:DNA ligase (ATP) n=1 Tax=Halopseudomonas pelagia TaxID=553151 RepID=A0AA91U3W0_9GAMM|nr:DNA ligase D [Halopseudomonas pelagia]PCC99865.1 DNA ligase D [Halopseudomonas pelagia]QFY56273.1 DNA ligase D [Halopseudomonas pelagia]
MARPESEYNRKRNFELTSEPAEEGKRERLKKSEGLSFVIQKHDARNLHYDFRLELNGTLKSWAVPKGPSLDPADKRLAVHVEDHPLSYGSFEGSIPKGQYGGGDVIVWDRGIWEPEGDPVKAYKAGKLGFRLYGEKLAGNWNLVRTRLRGSGSKEQWLLIKEQDEAAQSASSFDLIAERPESVITGERLQRDQQGGASTGKKDARSKTARSASKASKDQVSPAREKKTKGSRGAVGEVATMPEQLSPQLATLVSTPPAGDWLYEIKFDGYRILTRIREGEVRLFTRNGHDWTDRLPKQAKAIAEMDLADSWLDGEVVVLNDEGLPDFQALQNAFDKGSSQSMMYYLFDAPFLNGRDLREAPLEQRREALEALIEEGSSLLRFSEVLDADYQHIYQSACAMQLEGVIGKRAGSEYVSARSADWIKLKCRLRQEFVVVGYTPPKGSRSGFGALLLGVHDGPGSKNLLYAGRVGTGFNEALLRQLHKQLRRLERKTSPLASTRGLARQSDIHWVSPKLVCEVEFAQWTKEQIVRQAAFIALREDKPAEDIIKEQPKTPDEIKSSVGRPTEKEATKRPKGDTQGKLSGVAISHPERVIDKQSGASKYDLAAFYDNIQDWILPQLAGRAVSLVRAPEGVEGDQFFQKHAEHLAIPDIRHLDKSLDPGHAPLMQIDSAKALVGAVQMGCIELHTWGSLSDSIEKPDRIVLDLDPDPKLPWKAMVEATQLLLSVLDEIGLQAWLKTSGGKGMHVIIPVARHLDWDSLKAFSKAISEFMAQQLPERFVSKMGPKNRIGKIFIDYLRNSRGASTVAAYSARARPGLPVSVPISRDELAGLRSAQQWTVQNLHERLQQLSADPWADFHHRQRIGKAMWQQLGAKAP